MAPTTRKSLQPSLPGKLAWRICYTWFCGRRGNLTPIYVVAYPKGCGTALALCRLLAEPSSWVSPKLPNCWCPTQHPRAATPHHPSKAASQPATVQCRQARCSVEK